MVTYLKHNNYWKLSSELKINNLIMGVGGLEPPRAKSLDGF